MDRSNTPGEKIKPARQAWQTPCVDKMSAGSAENGISPTAPDATFTYS